MTSDFLFYGVVPSEIVPKCLLRVPHARSSNVIENFPFASPKEAQREERALIFRFIGIMRFCVKNVFDLGQESSRIGFTQYTKETFHIAPVVGASLSFAIFWIQLCQISKSIFFLLSKSLTVDQLGPSHSGLIQFSPVPGLAVASHRVTLIGSVC